MDSAIQGNTDEEVNGTIKTHEKTQEEVIVIEKENDNVEELLVNYLLNDLKMDISEESKTVDIFEESTLSESQDTFVEQINTLQEYIDAGKFPGDIQLGKRSAKHKKLEEESFDFTIYKQKQCGFAISQPIFWLQSICKYIVSNVDTYGKFYYKQDVNSTSHAVPKILVCYQVTKKVTILVNLLSGTLIVKGENFINWINDEFPKLLPDEGEMTEVTCTNLDGNHETAVDRGDIEKYLLSLWQQSMANKTTLENFDATPKKLQDEFDQHVFTHASVKGDISQLNSEFTKSDEAVPADKYTRM